MNLIETASSNFAREIENFTHAKEGALRNIADHEKELAEVEQEYDRSPMDETIYLRREVLKAEIARLRGRVDDLDDRIFKRQTQQAIDEEAKHLASLAQRYAELAAEDVADAKALDKQITALVTACLRVRARGDEMGRLARKLGVSRHVYTFGLGNVGAVLSAKMLTAGIERQLHCVELIRPGIPAGATAEGFAKRSTERLQAILEGAQ